MNTTQAAITRHLLIRGRVQGVYYRASMAAQAARLDVAGWVRNRRDGSVEAVLHGPTDAVAQLIDWAHRGPSAARVESVEVTTAVPEPPNGFEQRPTV